MSNHSVICFKFWGRILSLNRHIKSCMQINHNKFESGYDGVPISGACSVNFLEIRDSVWQTMRETHSYSETEIRNCMWSIEWHWHQYIE